MTQPVPWNGDPACGHTVANPYQTHYCTYIRVPALLQLQAPQTPDELLLITAYQWFELWLKVLAHDLPAALAAASQAPATFEAVKLLRRGLELFRLFDQHADLVESVAVRELRLSRRLSNLRGPVPSAQLRALTRLARGLDALAQSAAPDLAQAAAEYRARLRQFRTRFARLARATLCAGPGAPGPTYAEWLCLPRLLDLQQGVKAGWCEVGGQPDCHYVPEAISPDELMFVVVHQAFEVYFKVILDAVDRALRLLPAGDIAGATALLRRAVLVQRLFGPQIQMPATMLPLDFLRFREQRVERDGRTQHTGLTPASGTESYQFRELEITCGLRDNPAFQTYLAGSDRLPIRLLTPRQRERLAGPTLPEAFQAAVVARGLPDYHALFTPADQPNPNLDLAVLADTLLEFDEFFRFWRLGHVSMVEKMIGNRSGTGFLGPEYLAETAGLRHQEQHRIFAESQKRPRFFEELWAVRSRLGVRG